MTKSFSGSCFSSRSLWWRLHTASYRHGCVKGPLMPLRFKTAEDRDRLAKRLMSMAEGMMRRFDQGSDGSYHLTDKAVDDIRAAAAIVASCDVDGEDMRCLEKAAKEARAASQKVLDDARVSPDELRKPTTI